MIAYGACTKVKPEKELLDINDLEEFFQCCVNRPHKVQRIDERIAEVEEYISINPGRPIRAYINGKINAIRENPDYEPYLAYLDLLTSTNGDKYKLREAFRTILGNRKEAYYITDNGMYCTQVKPLVILYTLSVPYLLIRKLEDIRDGIGEANTAIDLSPLCFFTDADTNNMRLILKYQELPQRRNGEKFLWKGKPSDAMGFCLVFGWTDTLWNRIFYLKSEKPLNDSNLKPNKNGERRSKNMDIFEELQSSLFRSGFFS